MAAPALSLDLTAIAVDQPEIPDPIATALAAVQTTMNSLGNVHMASDAAIATTKLELGAGSATAVVLNNNVALQGKNTGGTAKDLVFLDSDDYLKLSQLVVQDVSGGVTTNTKEESQVVARGWNYVAGSGGATTDLSITLPFTFDDTKYDIFPTYLGAKAAGGNWANRQAGDSDPNAIIIYRLGGGTYSTTVIQLRFRDIGGGTMAGAKTYGVSWLIVGKKS